MLNRLHSNISWAFRSLPIGYSKESSILFICCTGILSCISGFIVFWSCVLQRNSALSSVGMRTAHIKEKTTFQNAWYNHVKSDIWLEFIDFGWKFLKLVLVFNPLNTGGSGRYVKVHIPWRPVYRPLTCAFLQHYDAPTTLSIILLWPPAL